MIGSKIVSFKLAFSLFDISSSQELKMSRVEELTKSKRLEIIRKSSIDEIKKHPCRAQAQSSFLHTAQTTEIEIAVTISRNCLK